MLLSIHVSAVIPINSFLVFIKNKLHYKINSKENIDRVIINLNFLLMKVCIISPMFKEFMVIKLENKYVEDMF